MYNLDNLRNKIDDIDLEIINLLEERFNTTSQVGFFKKENNINVENKTREEDIINMIKSKKLQNESQIIELYQAMFLISKKEQQKCKDLD